MLPKLDDNTYQKLLCESTKSGYEDAFNLLIAAVENFPQALLDPANIKDTVATLAAQGGNVQIMSKILAQSEAVRLRLGLNINETEGPRILHVAAQYGHLPLVELLLSVDGICVNAIKFLYGYAVTPLHLASVTGYVDIL